LRKLLIYRQDVAYLNSAQILKNGYINGAQIMVPTDLAMQSIMSLQSRVRATLARSTVDTPYEYAEESFFQRYELMRDVWLGHKSQRDAANDSSCGRHTIKELDGLMEKLGVIALLPDIELLSVDPLLERLAVLLKRARPHENGSVVLTLTNALGIPGATLDIVHAIHRAHGIGQRLDSQDVEYFSGLQKILYAIQFAKEHEKKSGHDSRDRKHTFFAFEHDTFQHRLELFRELSQVERKRKIRPILERYGIHPRRYYELKQRYLLYGIWGIVDLVHAPRKKGEKISAQLELKIIEERLMNPNLSVDRLIKHLELKCSRAKVQKIYQRWGLTSIKQAIPVRGVVAVAEPSPSQSPGMSAVKRFPTLITDASLKVNTSFERLLDRLKHSPIHLSNPGVLIIAPFLSQLGVIEALHTYGPETLRTTEITNNIILNVLRIVCGFQTVNSVFGTDDPSIALASGFSINPKRSRFYESFDELRFNHLSDLRTDAAIRARELGIIEGKEIALDYHCDPTDSRFPRDKAFTKAPDSSGDVVYAHRPHIIWDSRTNSIVNIAYCEGRSRGPSSLFEFCEKNLYQVIDREVIREIYADSEYTGERQLIYLITSSPNTDVTMCLKQNPRIIKWKEEVVREGRWEAFGEKYKIASKDFALAQTGRSLRFVVKREVETNETRCFGSTHLDRTPSEILNSYKIRWPVETGIKDLIENYCLNKPLGTSPEKVESHYYCVMLARLAVDYFLSAFRIKELRTPEDWRCVISTLRTTVFASQSCTVSVQGSGDLLITYLNGDRTGIKQRLQKLLDDRADLGMNKVPWWGNRGVRIAVKDEFSQFKN
jgi:hypothetical protein